MKIGDSFQDETKEIKTIEIVEPPLTFGDSFQDATKDSCQVTSRTSFASCTGTCQAFGQANKAYLFEALLEFEKAEKALNDAKLFALNNDFINYVDDVISRVNKKHKIQNKLNREAESKKAELETKPETSWLNRLNNLL